MSAQDMQCLCREKQTELKKVIENTISKKQKELMVLAMEFGFASAFCSRTCDMNESWFAAQQYSDTYQELKKKLEVE